MANLRYKLVLNPSAELSGPYYNVTFTTGSTYTSSYDPVLAGSPIYLPYTDSYGIVEIPTGSYSFLAFKLTSTASYCDNTVRFIVTGSEPPVPPTYDWYVLTNCSTTSASYSEAYSVGTFAVNARVTSGSVIYRISASLSSNPGGTLTPISASGFTGCPINEWYSLINCTTTSASYSEMYAENTFNINDRVTSASIDFRVDGIIQYNPGGTLTPISASGFTGCPTPTVYTYLINRDAQASGAAACSQYAAFNRASAYSYQSSITSGTFLYTDNTQLGNPAYYVPDGYYSDGTKYYFFSGGNTGTSGTNC
jgi:hypothetical protein